MTELYKLMYPKGGRPPKYETPEALWDKFVEYCDYTFNNPIETTEKSATSENTFVRTRQYIRPLTLTGFSCFAGLNGYQLYKRDNGKRNGFSKVFTRIEECVQTQQVEGAIAGVYKENIVARINSIADKTEQQLDHTSGGKSFKGFSFLPLTEVPDDGGDEG